MKLNPDCMKDILKYIEANQGMTGFNALLINPNNIINELISKNYTNDEISYNLLQTTLFKFVEKDNSTGYIKYITPAGHLALIKSASSTTWYF